ncbi:MAG: hypothetical protein HBSAPP03_16630 [Phycisphaerae bacterium]|nr:MAG: hypothetical protein HBSAPP03_16630 [Phycisphaerae bacterium]
MLNASPHIPPVAQTPNAASFPFTFINSLGTYVVTSSGLYFLTSKGYGFSEVKNYLLAVFLGVTYILGAKAASKARGSLATLIPGFTHRGLLVLLMILLGSLCLLPIASDLLTTSNGPAGDDDAQIAATIAQADTHPAEWPIWVMVLLYSPLMGILWPVVETYLSGGRSDRALRSTMGHWNVVWSAAGVASTFMIAPLVASAPALAIALVTVAHALAAFFLFGFTPEPAPHLEGHHEPHPPVYSKLLVTFQLLLPMGYVVMSALGPYLPYAARRLDLPAHWHAYLPAAWIIPRVVMFAVMQRWETWHGQWSLAVLSGVSLVLAFAIAILATIVGGSAGFYLLILGLALFGAAMAVIYSAALYYALEVGRSDVDAGGTHEALIGVGYTVGPALGLGASYAAAKGLLSDNAAQALVLACVLLLAAAITGLVVQRVRRLAVPAAPSSSPAD